MLNVNDGSFDSVRGDGFRVSIRNAVVFVGPQFHDYLSGESAAEGKRYLRLPHHYQSAVDRYEARHSK